MIRGLVAFSHVALLQRIQWRQITIEVAEMNVRKDYV